MHHQPCISTPSISISIFTLLLFIIFLLPVSYTQDEPSLRQCFNGFDCGSVKALVFPFWKEDSPEYCRQDGFQVIECEDNHQPVIRIGETKFRLVSVDQPLYRMTIAREDLWDQVCSSDPSRISNVTLAYSFLRYSDKNHNITFFYNCNSSFPVHFRCGQELVPVYADGLVDRGSDEQLFGSCHGRPIQVQVNESAFQQLKSRGLGNVDSEGWKLGFDVFYPLADLFCEKCKMQKGLCENMASSRYPLCKHPGNARRTKLIVGFCAGAGGVLITSLFFYCWLRHRRGKGFFKSSFITGKSSLDRSLASDYEKGDSFACVHVFTYKELEEATNNFDSNRELGDGGFGTVYYGKLRDSRTVAVKRLYENNYRRVEQFMNEVYILTRLRHPNLVSLYGCTSRHSRELLLVYEYVENGTVADHLHGECAKPGALPWHIRLDIAIETASALRYLHASDIIHRDVKTNNILLDNYFHVKVADFGLSRLFPTDVTHVSTAPQGTPGYVDPEYHQCYQLTSKSDVFSFGVVLTELISSKPAVDIMRHRHEINLWNMAINKIQNRALHELVDPSLEFETDEKVRKKISLVAEVAFQCLQNEKDMRPTMAQVFEALVGIQNEEYKKEKGEEIEMEAAEDEGGLLKSTAVPHSPDSVMIKWVSNGSSSTTTTTPSF
ncbi:hypothetical protein ES319_D09G191900v1 [Gossypium barbadense]|uniref:non-specific serine/threonine protein kinase n=1 Tax=Gossypium barbadense TaxID=3634 RepID=A0A5J5Q4W9_GOSBA|nr:hypothetical protein ES319_D09G191900v1 [Gossypium barbadense]